MLALLFKVFSTHRDFDQYGSLLCKTVLQPSVARRLVRSLSAPKHKEQVILPALRLLNEITRFNEGAYARVVYARRDFTLEPKILSRNIATWRDTEGQTTFDLQRKPTVRTASIQYLLTHLKYQDERAKAEILSNRDIMRAVLDHLSTDPPFLIANIFDVLKNHVFLDKTIQRSVKSRILNGRALSHIATLYRYELPDDALVEGQRSPDAIAHDFLCLVCTSPAYGIMLPTQGFYPHANEDDDTDVRMGDPAENDADFETAFVDGSHSPAHVRNVILADFIQTLRPYANTLHQNLVIAIFRACPELIGNYFHRKQDFNYDPKLTSTWIGFSAFLYQTIDLPVPQFFGAGKGYNDHPPPVASMLPSILPQPLTQQVLIKCLNSSSELIQFFAVRVLVVALQKVQAFIKELNHACLCSRSRSWANVAKQLVSAFSQRCPPMKTVITAFRQPTFQTGLKREAITRLLKLYYQVMPQVALEEKFDVSVPLCAALKQAESLPESVDEKAFRIMELEHWIEMARCSPSMRWWQKNSESLRPC